MQVGSMADRALIKKLYAGMSNEQLLQLSKDEGKFLTSAAITILYQEFLKRKLDTSIFPVLRVYKVTEHEKRHQRLSQKKDIESVWEHCLEAKYNGISDKEIMKDLWDMGLSYQSSHGIIHSMETKSMEQRHTNEKKVLKGVFIFLIGIGILLVTPIHDNLKTLASGCIMLGLLKAISGFSGILKYDKIIGHIQQSK